MANDPHMILFEGGHHLPLFRKTEKTKPVEYETIADKRELDREKEEIEKLKEEPFPAGVFDEKSFPGLFPKKPKPNQETDVPPNQ